MNSICRTNLMFLITNLLRELCIRDNYLEDMFRVIRVILILRESRLYREVMSIGRLKFHLKLKFYLQEILNNLLMDFQVLLNVLLIMIRFLEVSRKDI